MNIHIQQNEEFLKSFQQSQDDQAAIEQRALDESGSANIAAGDKALNLWKIKRQMSLI